MFSHNYIVYFWLHLIASVDFWLLIFLVYLMLKLFLSQLNLYFLYTPCTSLVSSIHFSIPLFQRLYLLNCVAVVSSGQQAKYQSCHPTSCRSQYQSGVSPQHMLQYQQATTNKNKSHTNQTKAVLATKALNQICFMEKGN